MRAKDIAAAHIAQGSKVTYSVVSGIRCVFACPHASRIASISACAVGSFSVRVLLDALAMMLCLASVIIAPTGTSSYSIAYFASSNARCMNIWS